jgi:hypothetical protein
MTIFNVGPPTTSVDAQAVAGLLRPNRSVKA